MNKFLTKIKTFRMKCSCRHSWMIWELTSAMKRAEVANNVSKGAVTRSWAWSTHLLWRRHQVVHQRSLNNTCLPVKVTRILLRHQIKWQPNKFHSPRVHSVRKLKRFRFSRTTRTSSSMVLAIRYSKIEIILRPLRHHLALEKAAWVAILHQHLVHNKMLLKFQW